MVQLENSIIATNRAIPVETETSEELDFGNHSSFPFLDRRIADRRIRDRRNIKATNIDRQYIACIHWQGFSQNNGVIQCTTVRISDKKCIGSSS